MYNSRTISSETRNQEITLKYFAWNSSDEQEVYAAALAGSLYVYGFLRRKRITLDPLGGGVWNVNVTYGLDDGEPIDPANTGEPAGIGSSSASTSASEPAGDQILGGEYTITTTGGTLHILQSLGTLDSISDTGGVPPDFRSAIGVTKESVTGVDIYASKMEFSITRSIVGLTLDYVHIVKELTTRLNTATFYGFREGEALFLGADITGATGKPARATYRFVGARHRPSVRVSEDILLNDVAGHAYIWCTYKDTIEDGRVVSRPSAAYVESLYEYGDFRLLGL
jgi:hypothetical protein